MADLHSDIMNLPADRSLHLYEDDVNQTNAYKIGHRDARHAAAELASAAIAAKDARIAELEAQLAAALPNPAISPMDQVAAAACAARDLAAKHGMVLSVYQQQRVVGEGEETVVAVRVAGGVA